MFIDNNLFDALHSVIYTNNFHSQQIDTAVVKYNFELKIRKYRCKLRNWNCNSSKTKKLLLILI